MASYNNSQNNKNFNTPVTLSGAGNVIASLSDYIIGIDNTAAPRTVTIPTASITGANANRGKVYIIKDQSGLAGTNNITIQPATGTINGSSSIAIIANFGEVRVYSDGSNWFSSGHIPAVGLAFDNINVKEFNANGTYTPTAGIQFCIVELIAGGGGSGGVGGGAVDQVNAGAGGGSGGYIKSLLTAAQIGASQAVTIGTGGVAGTSGGGAGGTGVATSLGTLVSATGGIGGAGSSGSNFEASATTGGGGGSPTVTTGLDMGSTTGSPGGSGLGHIEDSDGGVSAGFGGEQRFGGGFSGITSKINIVSASVNLAGTAGLANTGAGASGAISMGTGASARAGATGGTGLLLITEFIHIP